MILDFEQLPSAELEADLCIVGAGATGLALAAELADSGRRIVIVESGGSTNGSPPEAVGAGENVGALEVDLHGSRARGLGGTTQLWAGQCVPFEVDDFEHRDWVPSAEWPFQRRELDPYYRRAERLLKLPSTSYDEAVWERFGLAPPPLDPELLRHRCTVLPREVNMSRLTQRRLAEAPGVSTLLHASATQLLVSEDSGRVTGIDVRAPSGRAGRVRSPLVVLCAGAIENARLLLLSRTRTPKGIGNQHDQVGRYFQEHPNADAAEIVTDRPRYLQDRYGLLYSRNHRWFPRLALSAGAQRRLGTLQAAALVGFDYPDDSAVTTLRRLVRSRDRRAGLRQLAARPAVLWQATRDFAHIGWRRYVRGRSPALRPTRIRLQVFTEQEARAERRVTLGERKDEFGLPVARVDWGVSDRELEAARALVFTTRDEFARLGLGRVEPAAWLVDGDRSRFRDAYHHIGTTRMSQDPRDGVVDSDLQVHGVGGLYAAGASTFPSSSWANPVLTAVALTLRLGEHLRRSRLEVR